MGSLAAPLALHSKTRYQEGNAKHSLATGVPLLDESERTGREQKGQAKERQEAFSCLGDLATRGPQLSM